MKIVLSSVGDGTGMYIVTTMLVTLLSSNKIEAELLDRVVQNHCEQEFVSHPIHPKFVVYVEEVLTLVSIF